MDVNFMKIHNPNNPAPQFAGKSRLGRYSDSMLELDWNVGRFMDTIRAEAPNTIVIFTADNGAWQDAWPDAPPAIRSRAKGHTIADFGPQQAKQAPLWGCLSPLAGTSTTGRDNSVPRS